MKLFVPLDTNSALYSLFPVFRNIIPKVAVFKAGFGVENFLVKWIYGFIFCICAPLICSLAVNPYSKPL